MVPFADVVALVVVAMDIKYLEYYGDESIEVVAGWLSRHGLSLRPVLQRGLGKFRAAASQPGAARIRSASQ